MSTLGPVAALCEALDAQASILEAMVDASQRQVRALLEYRADFRQEQPDALAESRREMRELMGRLAQVNDAVQAANAAVPAASRPESVRERMSAVRSLAQALGELQRTSQFHAQRGLQLVAAWREILTPAGGGPTYARNGRPRTRAVTGSAPSVLEVDL